METPLIMLILFASLAALAFAGFVTRKEDGGKKKKEPFNPTRGYYGGGSSDHDNSPGIIEDIADAVSDLGDTDIDFD